MHAVIVRGRVGDRWLDELCKRQGQQPMNFRYGRRNESSACVNIFGIRISPEIRLSFTKIQDGVDAGDTESG